MDTLVGMTNTRAYLSAAASAVELISDPAVTARWAEPSALQFLTVGGLAAHLGRQILNVPEALAEPLTGSEQVSLFGHYVQSAWTDGDLESDSNRKVRTGSEQGASGGPEALLARVTETLDRLRAEFANGSTPPVVQLPWATWSMSWSDFLTTRLLEIAIHSDDLAASVGIETPVLPDEVIEPVVGLLSRLAVRRHGQAAVLRALARSERAPKTVSAF